MLETDFWQDKVNSQKIVKEKKLFENLINSFNQSNIQLKDLAKVVYFYEEIREHQNQVPSSVLLD